MCFRNCRDSFKLISRAYGGGEGPRRECTLRWACASDGRVPRMGVCIIVQRENNHEQNKVEDEVFNLGLNKDLTVLCKPNVVSIRNGYITNHLGFRWCPLE